MQETKKGKRHLGRGVLILAVCFLFAGGFLWKEQKQRQLELEQAELARQQQEEAAAREAAEREAALRALEAAERERKLREEKVYESPIDFEALSRMNPEIVAWLTIPGTQIDYPVVQTDNNDTYLKKDFEGNYSSAGTIFLDCDSAGDFSGRHSVFYGHHMRNGSMFADIVEFKDEEFFEENRQVILYLPDREIHLRTIAALYGDASGEKRRTKFEDEEHFQKYIDEMTKRCEFRELPEDAQQLYSFVTCSYEFENARTILYAVKEEDL